MTTMERLFMQIFDRKGCIESQMRQQVGSYGESVACNLLAAGVTPPPWLWDHGANALGCPGQRDLSRNEIIQGVLFRLPQATNPSINLHTIYTLPTRKSTNLSHHSSFSNETCISNKHILPEDIVVAKSTSHHKDDQRNCDIACSEIFEDSPGCGSLPNVLRHPEDLLNEKYCSANFADEEAVEQGAHQITWSMVTSLMPDSIREPSDAKNLISLHSKDGNGADPSLMPDNIREPSISSGFISNIATSNQACFIPTMLQKSHDLIANNSHDASARECCIHAVEKEFVSSESNFADSRLNIALSSSSVLSQNNSLVVTKKLSFDGIEVCCPADNAYNLSYQEQNIFCPLEDQIEPIKSMQSLEKDSVSKDSVHGSGAVLLEEDALHTVDIQSSGPSARSSFKENIESAYHAPSTSKSILYKELPLLSTEEKHSSLDGATSHSCLKFSEALDSRSSVYQRSPPASLIKLSKKLYNGEPTTRREICIADTTQHQASYCEPLHSLEKIKACSLTKDDITSLEEDACNYTENSSDICKFIKDEDLQRNSNSIPDLSEGKQFLHVGIVPPVEVMSGKAKVPTSIDNMEGKDDSCDIVETCKSGVYGTSHIPDRELWVMVSSIDSHTQQPDRSLVELIMEENHTGKLVENSICNLDILKHGTLSDNSVVKTDEVCLETVATKFSTVGTGDRRVRVPTSFGRGVENDSAGSSASACDASGCDGPALPSLDQQHSILLAKQDAIDITIRVDSEEILTDELQESSGLENKLKKVNDISKSSTSVQEDACHCKERASISPSEKNMYLELKKDDKCEDVMVSRQKSMIQPPDCVRTHNHSSEPRYFLRNMSRHGTVHAHPDLIQTGNGTSSKRPRERVKNACEISWPKRRMLKCYLDGILGTTARAKRHHLLHTQEDNFCSSKKHFEISSLEGIQITPSSSKSVMESNVSNADLRSNSEHHHKNHTQRVIKDDRAVDQVVDISLPARCTDVFPSPNLADKISSASIVDGLCFSESTHAELEELGSFSSRGDVDDRLNCFETIGYCSSSQSVEVRQISESQKGLSTYDSFVLSSLNDDMVDNDKFMPEFEGFSLSVSPIVQNDSNSDSDFPTFTEHQSLNVQRSTLTGLATPIVLPSENYKIDKVHDILQPLPNGLLEHMKINDYLCFHSDYARQFSASEQDKVPDLDSSLGSTFDCSFMEASNSHNTLSSGSRFGWTASKLPLTPPVQKSSSRKGSRRSASSSQTLGSNAELVCFRIDENSITVEDNDSLDKLSTSEEVIYSNDINVPDNKSTFKDGSSIYENAEIVCPLTKKILERGSLNFSNPKSLSASQISIDLSIGSVCTSNIDRTGDKENQYLSISGIQEMKLDRSFSHKSGEPETNRKEAGKNKSQGSIQEVCKKTNIISNVSSFVSMVKKKQEATTTKVKKEIKVKSLEAAEAAKRLEELKHNAREMRKAAAKLERERLEKEKQLKQKQLEEDKRRKEADIAARKRQREEEEKIEKGRKKRCIEEARKLQKEQEERLHRKKEEKELRSKAAVDDGRKHGVEEEAKQQLKSEREVAVTRKAEVVESAATKASTISSNAANRIIKDRLSTNKQNQDLQSYEISPYKDSDDEDGQETSLCRRKLIPSWAGRQCLDQLSLLQDDLDPLEIFGRKKSFSLNEVLHVSVARR